MKKMEGLTDENLKVVKEEEVIKKTPLEKGREFIEGFLDTLKSRKKYVDFYCDEGMFDRCVLLIERLERFLKDFKGKKMNEVKELKKVCKNFVTDFESSLEEMNKMNLNNLEDAKIMLSLHKTKERAEKLGEELVIWNSSNAAYLDMLRVVNGEAGLKSIYLKMVEISEEILAQNNINND